MAPRFSFTRTKQRKISFHTIPPGASQITVVTSDHSTLPHTITKCEPTNADSWLKGEPVKNDVYDVFWPVDAWDITTGAYTGVGARNYDRATELAPFGLPWSSSDGKKIALGFGTCVDVIHDKKHGEVNLCIYLGSGLPLANIADVTHDFLLNDANYWHEPGEKDVRPAGYYVFSQAEKPLQGLTAHDYGRVSDMMLPLLLETKQSPSAKHCYFIKQGHHFHDDLNDPTKKYAWTDLMPLPTRVGDKAPPTISKGKLLGNCSCNIL